jgi:hypothetical protein
MLDGHHERLTTMPGEADVLQAIRQSIIMRLPENIFEEFGRHAALVAEVVEFVAIGATQVAEFGNFENELKTFPAHGDLLSR